MRYWTIHKYWRSVGTAEGRALLRLVISALRYSYQDRTDEIARNAQEETEFLLDIVDIIGEE